MTPVRNRFHGLTAVWESPQLEFAFFMQDSSVLLRVLELLLRMTTVPDGPNPGTVDVAGAALQELRELSLALCPGFSWPGRNVSGFFFSWATLCLEPWS